MGGQDGSITILIIAALEDEIMTDEETIASTAGYLKNLPSRRAQKGARVKTTQRKLSKDQDVIKAKDSGEEGGDEEAVSTVSSLNTFEERQRDDRRNEVRRKFR